MRAAAIMGLGLVLWLAMAPVWAQSLRPVPRPDRPDGDAAAAGAVLLSSKSPVPRPADLLRGLEMRQAFAAAQRGDWAEAARLARRKGAVAADIIEWQRLRAGEGDFDAYRAFLHRRADWPGVKLLHKRGEASIPEQAAPAAVIAYFDGQPPQTGLGALRLAAALARSGAAAKSRAELVRAWTTLAMTPEEEQAILAAHAKVVAPHHAARLDLALWQEDIAAVRRMLPLVGEGWRALAAARLALQRRAKGVDALIAKVPAALADDPGLALDRMSWQIAKGRRTQAADMILARSARDEDLGRPDRWANWRRILARQEMRDGNYRRAYRLASVHHLAPGTDYADLEWLSGYLALRYLDDPAQALAHFRRFRGAVFTPISLGRAGYWEGRALAAAGDDAAAEAAYRDAARYQTSFYGLLAAEKLGLPMDPALTGRPGIAPWRDMSFAKNSIFEAAGLFRDAGRAWEASWFLNRLVDLVPGDELQGLADYAVLLDEPYIAVRVGKRIAGAGVVAPRAYYPLTELGGGGLPVPEELALSIARRESEFRVAAVSGAGARGLMQLMPGTAKQMAAELNLPYERARLTTDPVYNATLGSAYLAFLIETFGNNIVLVAAGYNAGPNRARRWIEERGDPRAPGVDVVDWIEHIPFRETRNYVMRVAESLPVYRARLSGAPVPIRLMDELKAR